MVNRACPEVQAAFLELLVLGKVCGEGHSWTGMARRGSAVWGMACMKSSGHVVHTCFCSPTLGGAWMCPQQPQIYPVREGSGGSQLEGCRGPCHCITSVKEGQVEGGLWSHTPSLPFPRQGLSSVKGGDTQLARTHLPTSGRVRAGEEWGHRRRRYHVLEH